MVNEIINKVCFSQVQKVCIPCIKSITVTQLHWKKSFLSGDIHLSSQTCTHHLHSHVHHLHLHTHCLHSHIHFLLHVLPLLISAQPILICMLLLQIHMQPPTTSMLPLQVCVQHLPCNMPSLDLCATPLQVCTPYSSTTKSFLHPDSCDQPCTICLDTCSISLCLQPWVSSMMPYRCNLQFRGGTECFCEPVRGQPLTVQCIQLFVSVNTFFMA